MSAESGNRTRTPLRGTGLSTRRVYRSTVSAYWPPRRPEPPRGADPRHRRYERRVRAGAGGAPTLTGQRCFWGGAEGEIRTRTPRRAPASEAGMSAFHHFRLRPDHAARASPGCRPPDPAIQRPGARRGGRHSADGGTCTPTPLTGHRGLGRRVCVPPRRPVHRRRVVRHACGGRTPYRDRTGDLLLEGEACWPFHQRGIAGRCRPPGAPGWSDPAEVEPVGLEPTASSLQRGALPDELRPRPDRAARRRGGATVRTMVAGPGTAPGSLGL